MTKDLRAEIETILLDGLMAAHISERKGKELPAENREHLIKRFLDLFEQYAGERERKSALKLWAKISVAVGLWLPAFGSTPEEEKAAKGLIRVMTKEKDLYLDEIDANPRTKEDA